MTSAWSNLFLGVIAFATLIMALIQIGAIVAALRLARQAQQVMTSMQQEVRPLIARANAIAEEASKTVALASAQARKPAFSRLRDEIADGLLAAVQAKGEVFLEPPGEKRVALQALE